MNEVGDPLKLVVAPTPDTPDPETDTDTAIECEPAEQDPGSAEAPRLPSTSTAALVPRWELQPVGFCTSTSFWLIRTLYAASRAVTDTTTRPEACYTAIST